MLKKIKCSFIGILFILLAACSSLEKANSLYKDGQNEDAMEMAGEILISTDEKTEKLRAANLLGKIGIKKGGKYLIQKLDDPDSEVLSTVIKNIGILEYDPASETLVEMVPDSLGEVLNAIGKASRKIGEPAVELMVTQFLDSSKKNPRNKYKRILIIIGPPVTQAIVKSLKEKSFFENRESFEILTAIKSPTVASLMIPYLNNNEIAPLVIEGLINLKSRAVDPVLKELKEQINKKNPVMKERLVTVLGGLESQRVLPLLESLSQDDSELVRVAVDRALFKLRGF